MKSKQEETPHVPEVCPYNNFEDCYECLCPFYGIVSINKDTEGAEHIKYGCLRVLKELGIW